MTWSKRIYCGTWHYFAPFTLLQDVSDFTEKQLNNVVNNIISEFGIGYSGYSKRLLHGGCKKECGEADEEIKGFNCDPAYKYCVRPPNFPTWNEFKKLFETDKSSKWD